MDQTSVLPRLLAFPIPRSMAGVLEHVLGIRRIETIYSALRALGDDRSLCARLLQHLEVTHQVSQRDLDQVPRRGSAVLMANHPFGILESAVFTSILLGMRSDVKFLANNVLSAVPEIRDLLIPVDPMGGGSATSCNFSGLRQALRFLEQGGMLVVFPAGEVSHFHWKQRSITDPEWNPSIARMLGLACRHTNGLSVIPAYVQGANSLLFQLLGLLHPRLRTALLARELLNKRQRRVDIRFGSTIPVDKLLAIPTDEERIQYLRWRTYLLASRQEYKPNTALPLSNEHLRQVLEPIAAPVASDLMTAEVLSLRSDQQLAKSGELSAYIARPNEIPHVLAEIGRLRELTFRAAGEGTDKSTDLDEFDGHYLHLFVWNQAKQELVGAYRLAPTDQPAHRGLYTATLFKYGDDFLDRMGPALELGRSFVRAEYQKGFAPLLLLWKGIGKYVAQNPRYKILFGPVSISNQYQSISRELMVSFLERHASLSDWVGLVSTRNPFRHSRRGKQAISPQTACDVEDLSDVVSDMEPSRAGVPVLLRQYLKLGGKLLGFNVDPKFSNALDGLILVDLTKTEPRLLERYLGKSEAAQFLVFQKGTYGAQ